MASLGLCIRRLLLSAAEAKKMRCVVHRHHAKHHAQKIFDVLVVVDCVEVSILSATYLAG